MPIDFDSLPMLEFRKGRELQWFPHELDYSREAQDWTALGDAERDLLLRQVVGFMVGERAVTHDLAPLQQALAAERGHMEEEMYLTQQLFEEAIHVEFFQRWMNAALPGVLGRDIPYPELYGTIFSEVLPEAMHALRTDRSPEAQMRACVVYHQIVEGVLAEVGYRVFYACLDEGRRLPALYAGVKNIQRDEARHVAFGTYFAQRLISERPELEKLFDEEMEKMKPLSLASTDQIFDTFGEEAPFGLKRESFRAEAAKLHEGRVLAVKRGALVRR